MDYKNSIDELFSQALKYKGSEQYKKFFKFIAKFNHYSRYNSMLVYLQNPAVTFFGTTWFWKSKFQRKIKSDAKPLLILAPNGPIILAYDLYDTTGDRTPDEFMNDGLNIKLFEVQGEFKNSYLISLKAFAEKVGIRVINKPLNFFNAGAVTTYISDKLEIYLKEDHTPAQHFATLCHELGHVLLGHTGHKELYIESKKRKINLAIRKGLTKEQMELEAETVNYLICRNLGLSAQSIEYLAGYIKDDNAWNKFSYEFVIKVADRLQGVIV